MDRICRGDLPQDYSSGPQGRRTVMSVFKKQGVYWIDYYVSGRRKRERIGPDKRLAETVLKKRQVAIAEGKYLDKTRVPRCTFDELAGLYLTWARIHHQGFAPTQSRVKRLQEA